MNSTVGERTSFSSDELKGFCVVADACIRALVNVPDESVVDCVRKTALALNVASFKEIDGLSDLEQRYYDRFFVSSHPAFVPLCEDSIRSGYLDGTRFRYGATEGRWYEHSLKCYQTVGFDYRLIKGYDLSIQKLKPDSMASELAFLSFLAGFSVSVVDPAVRERSEELFVSFAVDHANQWFGKAAECLERFDDDFYARVCWLAADAVAAVVG